MKIDGQMVIDSGPVYDRLIGIGRRQYDNYQEVGMQMHGDALVVVYGSFISIRQDNYLTQCIFCNSKGQSAAEANPHIPALVAEAEFLATENEQPRGYAKDLS